MSLDPILAAACDLEVFCRAQGWRFCFIGGIAVQRWGEPRFTADADLTLLPHPASETRSRVHFPCPRRTRIGSIGIQSKVPLFPGCRSGKTERTLH
jgi:hypothetical protein